jgi:hypothetical protein
MKPTYAREAMHDVKKPGPSRTHEIFEQVAEFAPNAMVLAGMTIEALAPQRFRVAHPGQVKQFFLEPSQRSGCGP